MLDPYLSCTYVKIYFIFSNGKEKKKKGGCVRALVLLVTVALQSVDFISNPSFQSPGETPPERASYISTCGCSSLFFHPQYVPKSVLASIKLQKKNTKKKKRTQRGVPVDFSILFFFFEALFSQDKAFFSV